jgi:hypothetical protein
MSINLGLFVMLLETWERTANLQQQTTDSWVQWSSWLSGYHEALLGPLIFFLILLTIRPCVFQTLSHFASQRL